MRLTRNFETRVHMFIGINYKGGLTPRQQLATCCLLLSWCKAALIAGDNSNFSTLRYKWTPNYIENSLIMNHIISFYDVGNISRLTSGVKVTSEAMK
jgi:hypothetical protein